MASIIEKYGNRIRIRVNALLYRDDSLLLVKHKDVGNRKILWAPPGGGVNFGETSIEAIKREVQEETGLVIRQAKFQFVNEFLEGPLHAIELFYHVLEFDGELTTGTDPEVGQNQIIEMVKFVTFDELSIMHYKEKHNILHNNPSKIDLLKLNGFHGNS